MYNCTPEESFNVQRQIALITQAAWERKMAEGHMTHEEWVAEVKAEAALDREADKRRHEIVGDDDWDVAA